MQSKRANGLHVAIIMDGNGRWAKGQGLPRVAGHRAGADTAQRIVEHAADKEIRCLTLYAFSADNWCRPALEVQSIFLLLRFFLRRERKRLQTAGIRLEVIGRRDRLPEALLREIDLSEAATAQGRRLHLRVAIDYSSRDSIAQSVLRLKDTLPSSAGHIGLTVAQAMKTDAGDVDLLIRTGGEKRLSDFLLWELAYAELWFTDRMWPEFMPAEFDVALSEFDRRERRFGSIGPDIAKPEAGPLISEEVGSMETKSMTLKSFERTYQ